MTTQIVTRFIHAFWLGSGAFLIAVAAPAAFRAAPNSSVAAAIVGAMLTRWHYIALAAPLALLILDWRRARVQVLAIVFVAILLAAAQAVVDLRIRTMRAESPVPMSSLSRQDPVRRQFGMLHGISSMLLVAQVIAAGTALAMDKEAYRTAADDSNTGAGFSQPLAVVDDAGGPKPAPASDDALRSESE
jgi:hypothetical protein